MNAESPRIAIIMRAKDEMPYPPETLAALNQQSYQDFRLYAIDSGSTDGTLEVIQSAQPHKLVQIAPEDYVPGKVLNRMTAETTEPIIVFLNADAIPRGEHCLRNLIQPILDNQADATMSKQIARPDAAFVVDYDYRRAYDPKNIKGENSDFFSAVCCAFRRELWEKVPFYEEGYAEDLVWAARCRQQGARFELILDSIVEHSHNYSFPALSKKKYRHGVVYARLFGQRPQLIHQLFQCGKEWIRDVLEALRRGKLSTIPYNLAYRTLINKAIYRGIRDGSTQPQIPTS